jgi:hypothetical protein
MNNRAGDQVWKEQDEDGIVQQVIFFSLTFPCIDQIGRLIERKKGDAQG